MQMDWGTHGGPMAADYCSQALSLGLHMHQYEEAQSQSIEIGNLCRTRVRAGKRQAEGRRRIMVGSGRVRVGGFSAPVRVMRPDRQREDDEIGLKVGLMAL